MIPPIHPRRAAIALAAIALLAVALPPATTRGSHRGDHPSGVDDRVVTPNFGYTVWYTDDHPPPASDANYVPRPQAQRIAAALDTADPASPAFPGQHRIFADFGFRNPDFVGRSRDVFLYDCTRTGGCGWASAPRGSILGHAPNMVAAPEQDLRIGFGHALFHKVQHAYVDAREGQAWGAWNVEGTARLMEDKAYDALDNVCPGSSCFVNEVNGYLGNTDRNLFQEGSAAALFWSYMAEQFGRVRTEPDVGRDFVLRYWERADGRRPAGMDVLRETIAEFRPGLSLEEAFLDFAIATFTKDLDTSRLPTPGRYRLIDHDQALAAPPPATDYGAPLPSTTAALDAAAVPATVTAWGSQVFVAPLAACSTGQIAGFRATGGRAAYGLVAAGGATANRLYRQITTDFARAVYNRPGAPYTRLAAVVAGVGDDAAIAVRFACGPGGMSVLEPTAAYRAAAGTQDPPQRFLARLRVTGPPELGAPSVVNLDTSDLTVFVGPSEAAANQARVLSAAYVQGEYWLVILPPAKLAGVYDLRVRLGDMAAQSLGSVAYSDAAPDQMLVVDTSGSMHDPAGAPKIDALRNAAGLFADAAPSGSRLGLATFNGNGTEPDDDAATRVPIGAVDDARRAALSAAIGTLSAGGLSALGDGLQHGLDELTSPRAGPGRDWIVLVSDGMENEDARYESVRPALQAAGVRVLAIALGPAADQGLMQAIARDTNGRYQYVDVDTDADPSPSAPLANRLADAYRAAGEAMRRHQRLWSVAGGLGAGAGRTHTIALRDPDIVDPVLTVSWANPAADPLIVLRRPGGAAVLVPPGVEIFEGPTHKVYQLKAFPAGDWSLEIAAGAARLDYVAVLSGLDRLGVQLDVYPAQTVTDEAVLGRNGRFLRGLPMPIRATLTDAGGPVGGADVVAEIDHPDGGRDRLTLFDDGFHDDGLPGDGIYANVYLRTTAGSRTGVSETDPGRPATHGSYPIGVVATGTTRNGPAFRREAAAAFHLFEFDPSIADQDRAPGDRDPAPAERDPGPNPDVDPDPDPDGDGMPSRWEEMYGLDPAVDDVLGDPDLDRLTNRLEWQRGGLPNDPDTDHGGEADGSEAGRGSSLWDGVDDALPAPLDVQVIERAGEHVPDALAPELGSNVVRYPASESYREIELLRSDAPGAPFFVAARIDPAASRGLHRDSGLVNGTTYCYRVVAIGAGSVRSRPSPVFCGTPRGAPGPPFGRLVIQDFRPLVDDPAVRLRIALDRPEPLAGTEMRVNNTPDIDAAPWRPFEAAFDWLLEPDRTGRAAVFAQLRSADGAISDLLSDQVQVVPGGSLARIRGRLVDGNGEGRTGTVELPRPDYPLVFADAQGAFGLDGVPPGEYVLVIHAVGFDPVSLTLRDPIRAGGDYDLGDIRLESLPTLTPPPTAPPTTTSVPHTPVATTTASRTAVPTPTSSSTPTPSGPPSPTPTAVATEMPSPTPTASPTSTSEPTPTDPPGPVHGPIYLPLNLRRYDLRTRRPAPRVAAGLEISRS